MATKTRNPKKAGERKPAGKNRLKEATKETAAKPPENGQPAAAATKPQAAKPETNGHSANGHAIAANGKTVTEEMTRILESFPRIRAIERSYIIASGELRQAEAALEQARERVKTKEAAVADLNEQMHKVIEEIENPGKYPLYQAPSLPNGAASTTGKPASQAPADESWKNVRLESLTEPPISEYLLKLLADAGIETMGELQAWTASGKQIGQIKGIAAGYAEKIERATTAYWERNKNQIAAAVGKLATATDPNAKGSAAAAGTPAAGDKPKATSIFDPIMAEPLHNLPAIRDNPTLRSKLSDLGLSTVREVFDRAALQKLKPEESLKKSLGTNTEGEIVWVAIKSKAEDVAQAEEKKRGATKIETAEQLRKDVERVEKEGGKEPEKPADPKRGKSARKKLHPELQEAGK